MALTIRNAMITPAPAWGGRTALSFVRHRRLATPSSCGLPMVPPPGIPRTRSTTCRPRLALLHGKGRHRREECDDVFRGHPRESGIGRFGRVPKAVEWRAAIMGKRLQGGRQCPWWYFRVRHTTMAL